MTLREGLCLPFSSLERVAVVQIPSHSCSCVIFSSSRFCLIYSPIKIVFIIPSTSNVFFLIMQFFEASVNSRIVLAMPRPDESCNFKIT